MIAHFARRILHIPVLRYVDDYFSAERRELAEHAMQCFARLTRILLGQTSIADRKLDFGSSLLVLGMTVEPAHSGIRFVLSAEKAQKYWDVIDKALNAGYLSSGMSFTSCQFGVHTVLCMCRRVNQACGKTYVCDSASLPQDWAGTHQARLCTEGFKVTRAELELQVQLFLLVVCLFLSGMGLLAHGCVMPFSGGLEFSGLRYRKRVGGNMSTTEHVTSSLTRHRLQHGVRQFFSAVVE